MKRRKIRNRELSFFNAAQGDSPAPPAYPAVSLIDGNHYIRGFDHRVGVFAFGQLKALSGLSGNYRNDFDSLAQFEDDFRIYCANDDLFDFSLQHIASA
jgi:hypothetical protein